MTYKELADDAINDIGAFVDFNGLTTSAKLRAVSEAIHELQKRTSVIETIVTIDATTLDAEGSVALPPSITVPRRGTYTPLGSGIAAPCPIEMMGRDVMAHYKLRAAYYAPRPNRIGCSVERNRLFFFPFQGLDGSIVLNAVAKMPIYATSRSTEVGSYWFGWAADLDNKFRTTNIPQEFEDAEEGITAYTAAKLLELIPEWRASFERSHARRIERFEANVANIMENLPDYDLNYPPVSFTIV